VNNHYYNKHHKGLAQKLRKEQTRAEKKLWYEVLCSKKLLGVRFLRQRPIGSYVVDFFAPDYKLIVEVDGVTHTFSEVERYDVERQDWLKSKGFELLRFRDEVVIKDLNRVRMELENWLADHPPTPLKGVEGNTKRPGLARWLPGRS
jgi:very-short-patch-repair endonuclease